MKAKINLKNIWAYIQGQVRYRIYYSQKFKWLMRKHIKEQIDWRIRIMNRECYNQGSCITCGCQTVHLQMADKPCDGDCYPRLYSARRWKSLKCPLMRLQEKNQKGFQDLCYGLNKSYYGR